MHSSALLACLTLCAACQSTALPEGSGRGMLDFDRKPPEGAELFERPELMVGDRFVFLRGGEIRLRFRVDEKSEQGYRMLEEESGTVSLFDLDLGERGQEVPGNPEGTRRLDPADSLFSWPLWVGKQWSCHYLSKLPGQEAGLPLYAYYLCDRIETLETGAGTFRCQRIWRRTRPATSGTYLERVSLMWYAPEVGFFVRRLDESTLLDLEEWQRQSAP